MKTNEAPEKIYLERVLCTDIVYDNWKPQKTISDDIEYTRTDAFIKKAEKWLKENQKGWILVDEDITEFINYMEGE